MNKFQTCSVAALQPFVTCLENKGIDSAFYLKKQMISPELVASGEGHIFKRQAWDFFDDVENREGLFEFGFLDGEPYNICDSGSIGVPLRQAVTLKDAIDTFSHLIGSFAEGNFIHLSRGPKVSWLLCYTEKQDRRVHTADQHTILILRQVVRLAAGKDWQPDQVMFYSTGSKELDKMSTLSGVNKSYLQKYAGVSLRSNLLAEPIIEEQSNIRPYKELSPLSPPPRSTNEALIKVLKSFLRHNHLPSIEDITDILGISRMTLFRSLDAEGTNYRLIVERVRFNVAKNLLRDLTLSQKVIAHSLCYSAPSNFSRAFFRMSGVTPGNYRKMLS